MSVLNQQEIIVAGMNHRTAPVEIREKLSLNNEEIEKALSLMKDKKVFKEAFLFSTCNRVEAVFVSDCPEEGIKKLFEILALVKKIPMSEFIPCFYKLKGLEAVKHIFRVSSSLDSMILGEPQILGQVKSAYKCATSAGSSKVILNRLFHRAFHSAKRVRSETGIGGHAVSISYAAIELGKKIFGSFLNKKVLLIGAGEMAELAVEHLVQNSVSHVYVANRTFDKGLDLAKRFSGSAIRFEEVLSALEWVDIIISSTGAPNYILDAKDMRQVMKKRKNRPIFFIDIAVPRDINPDINKIDNIYLYDVDDLQDVVEVNMEERKKEAAKGEEIIKETAINFLSWKKSLEVVPTIVELRKKVEDSVKYEVFRTMKDYNLEKEFETESVERMISSICSRLLHDPIAFLKNPGSHRDTQSYLLLVRNLFNLDQKKNKECEVKRIVN
ncbi:MAG: glutamyl-tRNA reductase [Desulforegulaceae bacterium]|nr:glutamyl-tRNA reductase [Desulforegulaceae bacterium]